MTRQEKIQFYLKQIRDHEEYLAANAEKLDVFEGNLLPHVKEVMKNSLSDNYFQKIKERIIPINVLTRIIDKLSKVYINEPIRTDELYQDFIDRVQKEASLDMEMSLADAYSHLFKGYALEPFLEDDKIRVRVLPFDRFIPISTDYKNPTRLTDFIKCMGKSNDKKIYFAYTDTEFYAFNQDGDELPSFYEGNEGLNIIGRIPVVYGNRSRQSIVPTQDTDIMQLTKMVPILLSDLAGAIMFQCFSIIVGINVKAENLTMSPNAFWSLKADNKAETGNPSIQTIKPEADIDKVLTFIKQTFAFWLETKGVRIGSLNNIDAGNAASGISKIIDEMDVYEIKKQQILFFKKEEADFWDLMKYMNNFWITQDGYTGTVIGDDYNPKVVFDEPSPEISRDSYFNTIDKEYKGGYLDAESAIRQLYPDLDQNTVEERAEELDRINNRGESDGMDQDGDQATSSL